MTSADRVTAYIQGIVAQAQLDTEKAIAKWLRSHAIGYSSEFAGEIGKDRGRQLLKRAAQIESGEWRTEP